MTVIRKNPNALRNLIRRYARGREVELAVGFPVGEAGTGTTYPDSDARVLDVAVWNNYGTGNGVPRRDFMTPGGNLAVDNTRDIAKAMIPEVNVGRVTVDRALESMGPTAQAAIQETITDIKAPPNAPETIKRKGSSNPLVDTGQMRNAVTYVVR